MTKQQYTEWRKFYTSLDGIEKCAVIYMFLLGCIALIVSGAILGTGIMSMLDLYVL